MPLASPLWETRASPVAGAGVFARVAIPAGVPVMPCLGRDIPAVEVVDGLRAMQIGPDRWLAEDPDAPDASDFVNHACTPNVGFVNGDLVLWSLRPIVAGEELFWDYSTAQAEPGWSVPCHCGGPGCRGTITGFFDLPAAVRAEKAPIALAWLRAAVATTAGLALR